MKIIEVKKVNNDIARMVAFFRTELRLLKGIVSEPDVYLGYKEMEQYLLKQFPVFAVLIDDEYAGYAVCRTQDEVVWVESIFVYEKYRRLGVASLLHSEVEKIAYLHNQDTVYNYVHPNNHKMIGFLKKKGYTVLNLIEIRKPHKKEKLSNKINVGDHLFDY